MLTACCRYLAASPVIPIGPPVMSHRSSGLIFLGAILLAGAVSAQSVTVVVPSAGYDGACVINSVNVTSVSGPQAATVDFSCTGRCYGRVYVSLILEGPAYAQYAKVTSDAYGAISRTYPYSDCSTCFPHPIPAEGTLATTTNTFGRPFKAVATVRWDVGPVSACASSGCLTNQQSATASTGFFTP